MQFTCVICSSPSTRNLVAVVRLKKKSAFVLAGQRMRETKGGLERLYKRRVGLGRDSFLLAHMLVSMRASRMSIHALSASLLSIYLRE